MRRLYGLAAVAIALLGAGMFLAENALHVPNHARPEWDEAQGFARKDGRVEAVQVRAADGALLDAWLFTPVRPNGSGVIALHGVADTRIGMQGHTAFLLRSGYTVLTPDSRAHGASGGPILTYGVLETGDVRRWADLLMSHTGITRLYGAGQSMGAAILIQSLACEPRFRALVADSPFATFREVAFDRLRQRGAAGEILAWPLIETGFLYARARYGIDLGRASPAQALRQSHTPVLLIHGTADDNIPIRHSRELLAARPEPTELWEVTGAGHVASFGRDPEGYARRITDFFSGHP